MIGQTKLLAQLNNYTLQTLPKTIMLLGESGSGKHTLVQNLASHLLVDTVEITQDTDTDMLEFYKQCPLPTIYLVDINKFSAITQNRLLKFIEEPSNTQYVVVIAESELGVLPTILNRCIKFKLDNYTFNELKQIYTTDNNLVYEVCKTPGQLKNIDEKQITSLQKLCCAIIDTITKVNYARCCAISLKINYKEDYDKLDFILFFNMLEYVSMHKYLDENLDAALNIYTFTNNYRQKLVGPSLNKENFFINFITQLQDYTLKTLTSN